MFGMKDYTGDVYDCKQCRYQWVQRPKVVRDSDGLKIKKILLEKPKNCSNCKSEYWENGLKIE